MGKIRNGERFVGERLVISKGLEEEEYRIINSKLARDGTFFEKVQLFNRENYSYDRDGDIIMESGQLASGFYINKEWKSELVSRLNFSPNDPKKNWLALSRVRFGGWGNHRGWKHIEGYKPPWERENEENYDENGEDDELTLIRRIDMLR